jgi:hypothetical protein
VVCAMKQLLVEMRNVLRARVHECTPGLPSPGWQGLTFDNMWSMQEQQWEYFYVEEMLLAMLRFVVCYTWCNATCCGCSICNTVSYWRLDGTDLCKYHPGYRVVD